MLLKTLHDAHQGSFRCEISTYMGIKQDRSAHIHNITCLHHMHLFSFLGGLDAGNIFKVNLPKEGWSWAAHRAEAQVCCVQQCADAFSEYGRSCWCQEQRD